MINCPKPFLAPGLLLALFTFGHWLSAAPASSAAHPKGTLCVMSYNLRYAGSNPPNAWTTRRPVMRQAIQSISPDVIGTQEGLFDQLKDIAADLPGYLWIGIGRDDGRQAGEFMAVFYRTNRLQPLSTNYFWLSDTPEVAGSSTWGNQNRRMVTTVKFRDQETNKEFYFLNTHFDHQVQIAREKSADLVRQRVEALQSSVPILLVGDFNAAAGTNRAYQRLMEGEFFQDTWFLARERRGEGFGTFNGFEAVKKGGPRIDWILIRGKAAVEAAEIVTFSANGQFPSDHCPVVTWLKFEN